MAASFSDWNSVASTFGPGVAQALQAQNVPLDQVGTFISSIAPTIAQGANNQNDPSNLAGLINARGGTNLAGLNAQGSGGNSQGGSTNSPYGVGGPDAGLTNLGAAGLSAVGLGRYGGYPVYNPIPSGQASIGGVQNVGSPTFGPFQPGFLKAGPGSEGPQMPGVFQAATPLPPSGGGTPQPLASGGVDYVPYQPGQAFARVHAPAAPGAPPAVPITQPGQPPAAPDFLSAHTNALADAGKAIFAHFGGDPSSATPADIADFHSQLQSAIAGGPPIKMRSGGLVPPVGMDSGGYVGDDQPEEARRRALSLAGINATNPGPAGQSYADRTQSLQVGPPTPTTPQAPQTTGGVATASPSIDAANAANTSWSGGQNPRVQAAGVIGGLASGLTAAAQQYAQSVKPWQMQTSAIPAPPPAKEVTLNQSQSQRGEGQQENPNDLYYRLRMEGLV
jgi:hypothetical protein